jgi:fatty acid desaturase
VPILSSPGPAAALRSRFRGHAARLSSRPGHARTIAAIAAHIASAVAVAAAAERLRLTSWAAWIATLPIAWFVIGSRFRALGNMMHECCHRTLVRGKRASRAYGHLLSFFDFTDFIAYAMEHLSHHRYLGDPVRDLDFASRRAMFDRLGRFGPRYLIRPLTLFHLPLYVRPVVWNRRDSRTVAIARAGFLLALVGLAAAAGWRALVVYYLVPYLTAYQIFRFWSDAADHAGLMAGDTEFDRARNHCFGWAPLNWLVFPRHDQYHLVHHLFPAVPTRRLRQMHGHLVADPTYAARAHDLGASRR